MRALMQKFLSQRPEEGHSGRYFKFAPRRPSEVRTSDTIADDPVIDRIAPKVALGSRDRTAQRFG
jgi:hypothetical protein